MNSIRIGGLDYEIKVVEDLRDGDKSLWGWVKHKPCEIYLDKDLGPQQRWVTEWHEVVHLILTQTGYTEDEHREDLVDALAHGIVQVLRDNPKLREVP